ncbi:hypothetical protein [Methylomonas koyamae]|uniref:hypothetical protein n=1 Tax=Methylomonas koyamae TaxID=702114 RepID=UPI0006D1D8DC|nr:hypothetical protein [Methylomonas koyamae]
MKTTSRFISVLLGALMVSSASGGAVENVIDNAAPLVYYEFSAGGITTYFTDCKGMVRRTKWSKPGLVRAERTLQLRYPDACRLKILLAAKV